MNVIKARTLAEAAEFLTNQPSSKIVAGGTDLIPRINQKFEEYEALCYIDDLPEMSKVEIEEDGRVFVGASVRLSEVAKIDVLNRYPAFVQAASKVASPQIRNQATIGGNILQENRCMYFNNQVPWSDVNHCFKWGGDKCFQYRNSKECVALFQSDVAPVLIAFDADAVIYNPTSGERELPVKDLYLNVGLKNIEHNEILLGVRWKAAGQGESSVYVRKTIRGSFDFPLLSCAVRLLVDEAMIVKDIKVVFGSAGVMPRVFEPAKEKFVGINVKDMPLAAKGLEALISRHIAPFKDVHINAAVRNDMAKEVFNKSILSISSDLENRE